LQGFGFDAAKNVGKYAFLQPKTGKFTPHNTLHKNTRKTPKFKPYLAGLGYAVPLVCKENERLF
jgi:hypothetical protein